MIPAGVAADVERTYLHPGSIAFSDTPALVTTILGSCVALCLYDEAGRGGGMNHYLLPRGMTSARCGEAANAMLLAMFADRGIPHTRLKAKLFGGATLLATGCGDLAKRNIDVAIAFLRTRAITLEACDVGGRKGRRLFFRTSDGSAWIREI